MVGTKKGKTKVDKLNKKTKNQAFYFVVRFFVSAISGFYIYAVINLDFGHNKVILALFCDRRYKDLK